MASSIEKVDKAIASINKGTDKKDEMKIMMAPYANWDSFLVPAPMSIALLGQLILISTDTDFTLQDKNNSVPFKFLKYPDSFRACLVQVSNSGWNAFNKAHSCMDQIRLYSGNVDGHVRKAVKFLISGSSKEVELMLPHALKSIENIADECVTLASSVEAEFVSVMDLVAELLEACTRAKGQYEDDLKETEIAIQVAKESKKAIEEEKREAEQKREEMMKQMKDAEREYKDALESVPSAGDLIGLAVTDMVIGVAKNVANFGGIFGGKGAPAPTGPNAEQPMDTSNTSSSSMVQFEAYKKLSKQVGLIKIQTVQIEQLASGNKKSEGVVGFLWNKIKGPNGALKIKAKLQSLIKELPATNPTIGDQVLKLCTDGIEICETLLQLEKALNRGDDELSDVTSRARQLSIDVENTKTILQTILCENSLSNKSPNQAKVAQQNQNADDSLVKSTLQSARFKTETAKANLNDTRDRYDKSCQEVNERLKRMGDVLAELAKLNPKKIDLETIRQTLIKGIKALAELREQWGKLVKFFQMLSNLVKCCLHSSLKEFVASSQMQMQLTDAGCGMSDTMRDVLFEQAFKANQIAYVVNSISTVYTQVSDQHIMDRITCLGKLIALDPEANKHEIMLKREELNQGCIEAQAAIQRIANEKKKEILNAFDQRIGRIEQEVESIMPPLPPAELEEIKEQAKSGLKMSKEAVEAAVDDLV